MITIEETAQWSFLGGISYLSAIGIHTLIVVDLKAHNAAKNTRKITNISSSSSTTSILHVHELAAIEYYKRRSGYLSYMVAPIACISLTLGILANLWFRLGDIWSISSLVVAFGTAYNNGANVVNHANSLKELYDNDDKKKNDKPNNSKD